MIRGSRFWLAAALFAGMATAMPASPAHGDASTSSITRIDAASGRLTLVADDVPSGSELDPQSVRVTLDGAQVAAEVVGVKAQNRVSPRRVAVLVVDTSGSMQGSRIQEARTAALAFSKAVPDDVLVGLVSFAGEAVVQVRPTTDRAALRDAIRRLQASGNTALHDGLVLGAKQVRAGAERSIVVLSDGADTASRSTKADAIGALRGADATTDIVLYQTDAQSAEGIGGIAKATNAKLWNANDAERLASTFAAAATAFQQQLMLEVPALQSLDGGAHTVHVTASYGSIRVAAQRALQVPGTAALPSVTERTAQPPVAMGGTELLLLLTLVFTSLLLLAWVTLAPPRKRKSAARLQELHSYAVASRVGKPDMPVANQPQSVTRAVLEISDRFVQQRGWNERIALQLDRANIRLRPHEWVTLRASLTVAAALLLAVALGRPVVGALAGGALAFAASGTYLSVRARRRLKAFGEQLPDGLQLVASSLQSGFSLPQALDSAARDGRAPLSAELGRALNEARLGAPLEDALDRVAERMDSKDFSWAVMAVRIQREVGGNLAEVLRTTVTTIRDRAALHRQVRALSAEGRLSMYILMALPIAVFLFLLVARREYASLLWTDPRGWVMCGYAAISMTVGYFWMRSVVRVEV